MTGKKTYDILHQLSDDDLKKLESFLNSPFHVSNGEIYIKFMKAVRKHYVKANAQSERSVFGIMYPEEAYDKEKARQRLSHISSKLNQHIYDFLAHGQLKKKSNELNHLLFEAAREKKLNIISERLRRDWQGEILGDVYNMDTFYNHFRFVFEEFAGETALSRGQQAVEYLIKAIELFDKHYVLKKLWLNCQLRNFSNIFRVENSPIWEEQDIQKAIRSSRLEHHPLVKIYFTIYQILSNRSNYESIQQLKKILLHKADTFDKELAFELYTYCANFYIYLITYERDENTKDVYLNELLEIYEDQIEKELLTTEKYVAVGKLKNIVSIAARLQHFERAKIIVETACPRLPPNRQESAKYWFLAKIHFERKEFNEALDKLHYMEGRIDGYFEMDTKTLEIQTFYEVSEHSLVEYRLLSFENYLRTNRRNIAKQTIQSYQDFIRITRRLCKLGQDPNTSTTRLENLKRKILENKPLHRNWLLEKWEDLAVRVR